ncbi:MAG TPA: hypothetical protein VII66_04365 [Gemmatimonadaceae bacterium]
MYRPLGEQTCRWYKTAGGRELRYAAFLAAQALARVHAVLGEYGDVDSLSDVRQLLTELASPRAGCIVLDPALVTPAVAETIAVSVAKIPRAIVAFSSVTTAALESGVILAQRTPACFVFRGTPNERSALERALLLTPGSDLGAGLLKLLEPNMERLPSGLRERLISMFRSSDGPHSPDGLAAACSLARRSLDRSLFDAGLVSARLIIEGPRIVCGYRAITTSRIPFKHVATMLGYTAPRTLDAQLRRLLGTTSGSLRLHPLSCDEAASRLAQRLTLTETSGQHEIQLSRRIGRAGEPSLTLISNNSHVRQVRRRAAGERVTKP